MEQTAADIIKRIIYATVATSDASGEPWNSPVYAVYDDELHFYWASAKESQHSQNIAVNPKAFLAIYDSTVEWGTGVGVFVQASAEEVTNEAEIRKICELRQKRQARAEQPPEDFMGDNPRRFYRATPKHIWVNQDRTMNGKFFDGRVELDVRKLKELL